MTVVTRFPPSPTGYLHIGGARTALFNWLYARGRGGKFILRIEDTDRERSTQEAIDAILQGMEWLGLDYDEGPYFQSQRFDRYREVVQQLVDQDKAYHCYCSKERLQTLRDEQMARKEKPRYDGRCRDLTSPPPAGIEPVVRFRTPLDGEIVIEDRIHGGIVISNLELDDLIIARADGVPTYHLSAVVDDIDMGVTHVIRGDDHINNTPRQIHILEALGATRPVYAHLPMIHGADGGKLSKRHGAVSVLQYREDGFLPEALLNYLARLGWAHGDQEIFSCDELIAEFDLEHVHKAAATFDIEKLLWVNQQYIQTLDLASLTEAAKPHFKALDPAGGPALAEVVDIQRTRAKTLVEIADKSRPFLGDIEGFEEAAANKHLRPVVLAPLKTLRTRLETVEPWQPAVLHALIEAVAAEYEMNLGKLAQPLRVAVTGTGVSPSIDATVYLVGRARCLGRLARAIELIEARAAG